MAKTMKFRMTADLFSISANLYTAVVKGAAFRAETLKALPALKRKGVVKSDGFVAKKYDGKFSAVCEEVLGVSASEYFAAWRERRDR